jgi:hypothetical protein
MPVNKSNTFPKKLKSYSLLAGTILASSFGSEGQVIYTDIPDKELGGIAPSSFPHSDVDSFDLNNDGQYDFKLTVKFENENTAANGFDFREYIEVLNNPENAINYYSLFDYTRFVLKKDSGDIIPGNFFNGTFKAYFAFQDGTDIAYNWKDEHDKCVALKFHADTNLHYGWIRLDVNTADSVPNIIIKDFAYEATPDLSIAACDTGLGFGVNIALIQSHQSLTVFPNPSNGNCIIQLKKPLTGDVHVCLKDAIGKEVYQANIQLAGQQNELPFNFSELSPGMYFIQLFKAGDSEKSEKAFASGKLIKN